MRLSTSMIYQQNMNGISQAQSLWMSAGEHLSTGKKVINPSDDPIAASRAVVLAQSQAENAQFTLARTFAKQNLSLEENTLGQVTSVLQTAMEKVVYAGNGTLSDNDRGSLAKELQGMRDQILNLANSQDGNGRYIFAGYVSEAKPFTADAVSGAIDYRGGEQPIAQQVDSSRQMIINHTGRQVFMTLASNSTPEPDGSAGESNLFTTLDTVIAALKVPVQDGDQAAKETLNAAVDKANRGLKNSYNAVLSVRSELGVQLAEIDNLKALGEQRAVTQQQQMSELVDVDYNAAISTYVMQQAALQASYKTFSDMSGMSLFQLNR
ncbi:flagellar hook-associated protein FlgL [Pantoea sp. 1.19]|uniref:flagellar hook-associated protein FlgL n=1 Tax=Pantoea sp. 1.19 TaxID=1925589 RepID=UPI00094908E9|nr:flagellar hook-associated protein FlgL [Pantoea sp. 1.19]